jgi:hypothetical protein
LRSPELRVCPTICAPECMASEQLRLPRLIEHATCRSRAELPCS